MSTHNSPETAIFSSVIIGVTSLTIRCGEALLSRGHIVRAVISSETDVEKWAQSNDLPFFDIRSDWRSHLARTRFDYLFSIVNPYVLNAEVLSLAEKWSINYHDGPLPRYGGVHATSWALINRELTHGITWHVMAERVDAGEILAQRKFAIAGGDTALTLNAQCYDAAHDAFSELVDQLATGTEVPLVQDQTRRTFFLKNRRPAAACVISWANPAEEIDALIRALDFGPYPNTLGAAKMAVGDRYVIVKKASIEQSTTIELPGTITNISQGAIHIATGSGVLALRSLMTLEGRPIRIPELVDRNSMAVGQRLPEMAPEFSSRVTDYYSRSARSDSFWVRKLTTASAPEFPYIRPKPGTAVAEYGLARLPEQVYMDCNLFHSLAAEEPDGFSVTDRIATAFCAYVARVSHCESITIGYSDSDLYDDVKVMEGIFATHWPITLLLDRCSRFHDALLQWHCDVESAKRRPVYARDICARFPVLVRSGIGPGLPIHIIVRRSGDHQDPPEGCALALQIDEVNGCLAWLYDRAQISPCDLEKVTGQFAAFVQSLTKAGDKLISDIPVLNDTERQKLLVDWNDTFVDYPGDRCVHNLFEEQVERTPDAPAVVTVGGSWSYSQINSRANQLANLLRSFDIEPNVPVGVLVERSDELIVSVLAIMKAGGAYIPLDENSPSDRILHILKTTAAPIVVTQGPYEQRLLTYEGRTIFLDRSTQQIAQHSHKNPILSVGSDSLAYVMFTSGSTGNPKGIAVPHSSLTHFVHSATDLYSLSPTDRVLQFASIAFDTSIEEIFPCLTMGATVYVRNREMLNSIEAFWQRCEEWRITMLSLPTAFWHELTASISSLNGSIPLNLRLVIIGGEKARADRLDEWRRYFGQQVKLLNTYGPTETTVVATACDITGPISGEVPIGRPISNVRVYLLDEWSQPVPQGVIGEIHVGGRGVARGYLNDPDRTKALFVDDPFITGGRMYRTGDLGRYREDGNIDFMGRRDDQVKIRGFRIELGEIEFAIRQHPSVQDNLVLAREDVPGERRLVAYIVYKNCDVRTDELRSYLKQKLPEYMVPGAFISLLEIPLSPNGKVDRKALPAPGSGRPEIVLGEFEKPRTTAEEKLAHIWSDVLRIDKVGIHDNFFELGGDSILRIQIISRAAKSGLRIQPKQMFQYQTIAELAAGMEDTSVILLADQGPVEGVAVLGPVQQWFFEQNLPEPHHYSQAVLLECISPLDHALLESAIAEVSAHHDALRLRYHKVNECWIQTHESEKEASSCRRVDLSGVIPEQQAAIVDSVTEECMSTLDLSRGPLLQAVHFAAGAHEPERLLIVVHHLVVDGISWRVLLEDLSAVYESLSNGKGQRLPPKTTSFKHWTECLKRYADSDAGATEAVYWTKAVGSIRGGASTEDRDRANTVASERVVTSVLGREETGSLIRDVPAVFNSQINEVLLSALWKSFKDLTGESDLLIDMEGHGREALYDNVDLSRTVGWFTSVFPVMLSSSSSGPTERLHAISNSMRKIPNKGIGFGILKYLSGVSSVLGSLRSLASPRISFNYLGRFDQLFSEASLFSSDSRWLGLKSSLLQSRSHEIEIDGWVQGGRLVLDWRYSEALHTCEFIQSLAEGFNHALRELIECAQELASQTIGHDPSEQANSAGLAAMLERYEAVYPLSPQQKGLLFETLGAAEHGVHIEQEIHTLTGDLDADIFERAWQSVVNRHPGLRAGFVWSSEEQPVQVICRDLSCKVEQHDWRSISFTEQSRKLNELVASDRSRGFDLSIPPLFRMYLIRTSEQEYRLVRSSHHILMDGWCLPILNQEMHAFYVAELTGRKPMLEPVYPYQDYIAWTQSRSEAEAEAFWLHTLAGFTTPNALGHELEPSDSVDCGEGYGFESAKLTSEETAELLSVARRSRVTLSSLVQAAWAILLSRYSGRQDVVFGTTVSGRSPDLPGVESMIGLFANTLPLRLHVKRDARFTEWLPEVLARHLDILRFEHCSSGQTHEWSELPGVLPLFESIIVYENYPEVAPALEAPGARIGDLRHGISIGAQTNYPATFLIIPAAELEIRLIHKQIRIDNENARLIVAQFADLLRLICAAPDEPVASFIESIPTSAIPAIKPVRVRKHGAQCEPCSPTEELLASIWRDVLDVDQVNTRDSFFDLGGHSLLATQVVIRIRIILDVDISIRTLFKHPTIAKLAEAVNSARHSQHDCQPANIQSAPRDNPLPMSYAQQRLWLIDQLEPGSSVYNVPITFKICGEFDREAARRAVEGIIHRHEALRTYFSDSDGEPVQIISDASHLELPFYDLSELPETDRQREADRILSREACAPFDLGRGPMIRVALLRLAHDEHCLLLVMHHIVTDAWSMGVLIKEFGTLYEGYSGGQQTSLAPLAIQYGDYAVWQRDHLRKEVLAELLDYWKQHLAGAPQSPKLPMDRSIMTLQSYEGAQYIQHVPKSTVQGIVAVSRREGATPYMAMLAAFYVLMAFLSDQDDIVLGTNFACRNLPEVEPLIGFFINQLPLRINLKGNPTFREIVGRVRQVALQAFAHQELPFDKLVESLKQKRELNQTPVFQTLFVQNTHMAAQQYADVTMTPVLLNTHIARFNLAVFIEENQNDTGITGTWIYKTALFNPDTVSRFATQYEAVVSAAVENPNASLKELKAVLVRLEHERHKLESHGRESSSRKAFESVRPKLVRID